MSRSRNINRDLGVRVLLGVFVVGAVVLLAADDAVAQGCAMCSTYLNDSDPAARGMKFGILFLMATPFTMLATVGGWFYYMYRASRRSSAIDLLEEREGEL